MVIRIQIDIWIVSVVSILWILIPVTHLDCGTHVLWFGGTLKVNKHGGSTFSAKKINFANIRGIRHHSELVFTLRHADYHNRPLTGGEESHQYLCIPGRDITDRTRDTE